MQKLPTWTGVEFLNHLQYESFLLNHVSNNPLKVLGALLNCCFRQVGTDLTCRKKQKRTPFSSEKSGQTFEFWEFLSH